MQQFSHSGSNYCPGHFEHDGIQIHVTCFAGEDHSAATTVFFKTETYHADKRCPYLHSGEPKHYDDGPLRFVSARTLEHVITTWNGLTPCFYCTQPAERAAKVAMAHENVPASVIKPRP